MIIMESSFRKKGVSPLIATVLLISFAVALASVVMNWGTNLPLKNEEDVCSEINLRIKPINGLDACYKVEGENLLLSFTLQNLGDRDVDGIGIRIDGEKSDRFVDFNDIGVPNHDRLEIIDLEIQYSLDNYGEIQDINFIPKMKRGSILERCDNSNLKTITIDMC